MLSISFNVWTDEMTQEELDALPLTTINWHVQTLEDFLSSRPTNRFFIDGLALLSLLYAQQERCNAQEDQLEVLRSRQSTTTAGPDEGETVEFDHRKIESQIHERFHTSPHEAAAPSPEADGAEGGEGSLEERFLLARAGCAVGTLLDTVLDLVEYKAQYGEPFIIDDNARECLSVVMERDLDQVHLWEAAQCLVNDGILVQVGVDAYELRPQSKEEVIATATHDQMRSMNEELKEFLPTREGEE